MKVLLFLTLNLAAFLVAAQEEHLKPTLIDNTDPSRWIYESPVQQPGIRGDQYLFDIWKIAKITFKNDVVKDGFLVNYNLEDQELEISTTEGIKILPKGFIKQWTISDGLQQRSFQAVSTLGSACLPAEKTYGEILSKTDGLTLIKIQDFTKKNPTYNERLGIGDNNYRILKADHFYILQGDQCTEIAGGAGKREKTLVAFLRSHSIEKIIDDQDLNIKDESDLIVLIQDLGGRR
jgi:hypothetical protein